MIDVKLKLTPGHASDKDWMADSSFEQIFWNINSTCNFQCGICFSSSGPRSGNDLTTAEARKVIRDATKAEVKDIVVSGGEPFLRPDLFELLVYMKEHGVTARIATNGSLLNRPLLEALRRETSTKAFQVSLDSLDRDTYREIHKAPAEMLDTAVEALAIMRELGFHTTVSSRLGPKTLRTLPALLDRAVAEDWSTVTIHLPLHTGRIAGSWPQNEDLLTRLEPIFEHFLSLPKHWLVETNIPWAPYHPVIRKLSKRIRVAHAGCGACRCRIAIHADGTITPCICINDPAAHMGNVRHDDLGAIFRDHPLAALLRHPDAHDLCTDCKNVTRCGAGCRASALVLSGTIDGLDGSCPVRRLREKPKVAERVAN
jgi:radical SAM protein with 4Fe4S-binding SPASM domain